MSAKKRAIGDTEDEFQAALATYTKAGNKTIAMRRLWNAAYEIGRGAAEVIWVADIAKERESERVEQARQTAFEEGRQVGEKDALTMDTFEVSFSAGKMDGIATGIELGRQEETQRWKDNGHFEDATAGALLRSPDTHSTTATPAISFHRSYYNSTSTTTLFCATTTRPRTTLEAFSRWALHSVGAFGMGLDAGTLGFGLESETPLKIPEPLIRDLASERARAIAAKSDACRKYHPPQILIYPPQYLAELLQPTYPQDLQSPLKMLVPSIRGLASERARAIVARPNPPEIPGPQKGLQTPLKMPVPSIRGLAPNAPARSSPGPTPTRNPGPPKGPPEPPKDTCAVDLRPRPRTRARDRHQA
ncbi:hypothetical protein K438DRAFT_2019345 [Mycena galopus ATCC 62051]|nr:hypothetical protein K438DRAFT_2019345 [Mycena galopus ATCC 62051]